MRNRKLQIVAILLFSLYIGVFGILYAVLPKESFSEKEKRVLAAFPETTLNTVLDGSFESGFVRKDARSASTAVLCSVAL